MLDYKSIIIKRYVEGMISTCEPQCINANKSCVGLLWWCNDYCCMRQLQAGRLSLPTKIKSSSCISGTLYLFWGR